MTTLLPRHRNATDRILRMFAAFTGVGYLFYLLLLLPAIVGQAALFESWWTPVTAVCVFGCGLAFGVSAVAANTRMLRITGSAAAIVFLIAIAAGLLSWRGPEISDGQGIWLSTFPGVASLAAAASWRPVYAFGHMVVACVGVQVLNAVARTPDASSPLIPDITFAIMFCTIFVGAAVMALRTGRILDSTLDVTHAAAAAAAAANARRVERSRFDALIHDGVMSTLLMASRQGSSKSLSAQATRTLRQFDALRAGPGPDDRFDAQEIVTHLRTAAGDVDENIALEVRRAPGWEELTVPAESLRAIGSAVAEAVHNSVRHAGPGAQRSVTVTLARARLVVRVADTGVGFDPKSVPAHRLGLAVSIAGRMRQMPGGTARIESRPGAGTRVHLGWSAR